MQTYAQTASKTTTIISVIHLQDILFVSNFDWRHENVLGTWIVDDVYSVAEQAARWPLTKVEPCPKTILPQVHKDVLVNEIKSSTN